MQHSGTSICCLKKYGNVIEPGSRIIQSHSSYVKNAGGRRPVTNQNSGTDILS
jgi:hypothetical protein